MALLVEQAQTRDDACIAQSKSIPADKRAWLTRQALRGVQPRNEVCAVYSEIPAAPRITAMQIASHTTHDAQQHNFVHNFALQAALIF